MKIERILFPTDFSEGASNALSYAAEMAQKFNAELHIVHVLYDFTKATGSHVPHISADELYNELNNWAKNEIEKSSIEQTRDLKNIKKTVLNGIPYEEIIKYAEKEKIDLIVIGTYGRSGLERFIFGSTAERVVRRAPCAVMTVRLPEHRS